MSDWSSDVCSSYLYFGGDYAETLRQWRERFDAAVSAGRLPAGFDARFVRLWRYYLQYCEGGFRGGGIEDAQVTLDKTVCKKGEEPCDIIWRRRCPARRVAAYGPTATRPPGRPSRPTTLQRLVNICLPT